MRMSSLFTVILFALLPQQDFAVTCHQCTSRRNSTPPCRNLKPYDRRFLVDCKEKNYCIKIIGETTYLTHNIVIRDCHNYTRKDRCGLVGYNGTLIRGCLYTCNKNGCNSGHIQNPDRIWTLLLLSASITIGALL